MKIMTMLGLMILIPCLTAACSAAGAHSADAAKAGRYIRAYPDFFVGYEDGFLVTRDGKKILFNDGRPKDFDRLVTDPSAGDDDFDPEDAFCWDYPAGSALPTEGSPPGAVFRHMYGATPAERGARMRTIKWVPMKDGKRGRLRVTTVNGVDRALERVAAEIMALPENQKACLKGIVLEVNECYGSFERPVRGYPRRTSGHAYGIAVDINGDLSYFIGSRREGPYEYRNNLPKLLVDIFERNGFIWGGRWHSYDAMHFEYRPELPARRSSP